MCAKCGTIVIANNYLARGVVLIKHPVLSKLISNFGVIYLVREDKCNVFNTYMDIKPQIITLHFYIVVLTKDKKKMMIECKVGLCSCEMLSLENAKIQWMR